MSGRSSSPLIGDQAHLSLFATQIQTNMKHEHSFPWKDHGQDRSSPQRALSPGGRFSVSDGRPLGATTPRAFPCCSISEGPTSAATPPPGGRPSSHSLGEATGPVISAAIRMYGSHTSEKSMLAEGGVIERDFGKGDEERLAYSSV